MRSNIHSFKEFLKIQRISLLRYWKSFPILWRLFVFLALIGLVLVLYKVKIDLSQPKNLVITLLVFTLLCLNFSFSKKQKTLFNNYGVSVRHVLLCKTGILTIPFIIINPLVGGLCVVLAVIISLLQPNKISIKRNILRFKPRYIFIPGSFQWHSFYRIAGFYIHLACLFLIIMGIIHNNHNLCIVSFLLLGMCLGIFSGFKMEPVYFLKAYPNPMVLIYKKTIEIVFNLAVLLSPILALFALVGINIILPGYIFLAIVSFSLVSTCVKYANYPDEAKAIFMTLFFIGIVTLGFFFQSWFLLIGLVVILFLYYRMYRHLSTIYSQSFDYD